jgi:hypothetical protein
MNKTPTSFSAALILILLNALIWLAFGSIVAAGVHPSIPNTNLIRWTMSTPAFLTAGALIALCFFLKRRYRLAYYLAVALLVVISCMFVFDQFGLSDLIALILTLTPLVLLIKSRAWYLRLSPGSTKQV